MIEPDDNGYLPDWIECVLFGALFAGLLIAVGALLISLFPKV